MLSRTHAFATAISIFCASIGGIAYGQIRDYDGGSTYGYCHYVSDQDNVVVGDPGPFLSVGQSGSTINVTWSGDGWDKWHFRWGHPGKNDDHAYEYKSDVKRFTLTEPNTCVNLLIQIQGCVTHVIGHDRCSAFIQQTYKTDPPLPSGPDTCASGFVWRGTYPEDHACVSPQVRDQAASDNARGQLTPCPSGLVPRNAHANDRICVTQAVADEVRRDNGRSAVCSRLVHC